MKITAIDTFTLRIPTAKPIALDLPEHRLVVTRIRTDAGLDGLGYALVFGGAGSEAVEAYARRLAVLLVGEDPTQVGRLWVGNSSVPGVEFSEISTEPATRWQRELTADEIGWVEWHCRDLMPEFGY